MNISNAAHWQPALTGDGVVEGLDDVHQCILLILGTPLGSVPHRPMFGWDGIDLLDGDIDTITPQLIQKATDAVLRWEPRILKVTVMVEQGDARAWLRVTWWPADNLKRETQVIL